MPHTQAVLIPIRPSRVISLALVFAHVAAAISVLVAGIPSWLAAILLVAVGASAARQRRRTLPEHIVLHPDGRFALSNDKGAAMAADSSSAVLGSLVVLRYRKDSHMQTTLLAHDCFTSDEDVRLFHRWFRWQLAGLGTTTSRG